MKISKLSGYFLSIFLLTVSLSGCQNFLNGKEIKKSLEDQIAYEKAEKTTATFTCSSEMGEVLPYGKNVYLNGTAVEVSFTSEQNITFVKWKASNSNTGRDMSDYVSFSDLKSKKLFDGRTRYSANVTFIKSSDEIVIKPFCYFTDEKNEPTLVEVKVYKRIKPDGTVDKTSELSDLPYTEWTNGTDASNDTYYQNHAAKLYIYAKVYDAESGCDNLYIQEKLVKSEDGQAQEIEARIKEEGAGSGLFSEIPKEAENEQTGEGWYEAYIPYDFESAYDGIIQLKISARDRCGNQSQVFQFDVLKDSLVSITSTNSISLNWNLLSSLNNSDSLTVGEYKNTLRAPSASNLRQAVFNSETGIWEDTFNLRELNNIKSSFYINKNSSYECSLYWTYDENGSDLQVIAEGLEIDENGDCDLKGKSFVRDAYKDTYIFLKAICPDTQLELSKSYKIPATIDFVNCSEKDLNIYNIYKSVLTSQTSKIHAYTFVKFLTDESYAKVDVNSSYTQKTLFTQNFKTIGKEGLFGFYCVSVDQSSPFYILGAIAEPYKLNVAKNSSGIYKVQSGNESTLPDFSVEVETGLEKNTGLMQLDVLIDKNTLTEETAKFKYSVKYEMIGLQTLYVNSLSFNCKSDASYKIYLCAQDKDGVLKGEKLYVDSESNPIIVSSLEDNTVPEFGGNFDYKIYSGDKVVVEYRDDTNPDKNFFVKDTQSGLEKQNVNGTEYYMLHYYFVPREYGKNLSIEDLSNFDEKILYFKGDEKSISIPYLSKYRDSCYYVNGLTLANSYLYLAAYDNEKNMTLKCVEVNSMVTDICVNLYESDDSVYWKVKSKDIQNINVAEFDTVSENWSVNSFEGTKLFDEQLNLIYKGNITSTVEKSNGKYLRINGIWANSIGCSLSKIVYADALKTSTKPVCEMADMYERFMGITVLTDQPAFIHTLCCDENLGEEQDKIPYWETYGGEYNPVVKNSSFTYKVPEEFMPKGYYYVVVAHFADGTQVMSVVHKIN